MAVVSHQAQLIQFNTAASIAWLGFTQDCTATAILPVASQAGKFNAIAGGALSVLRAWGMATAQR